jgi:TolB protein
MKALPFFIALFAASALLAEEPKKLAYEQADAVWVASADGTGAKKIAGGQSPDLSPDGTKLAFNTVQAVGQPAHRNIAVADLASGEVKILKDVPSDNCMGAVWSPDGSKILFTLYVKDEMKLGIVSADGMGYQAVEKAGAKPHAYWSSTWAQDGKSIYAQDMETIYQLGLDGSVIKKWVVTKLIPKGSMSGDTRLDMSPDGTTLLMDVEMDEPVKKKHWDGPLPAIWTLYLATGKTARITPRTQLGWDAHWFGSNAIVFASEEGTEQDPSIYIMGLNGQGKKLLVKNARLPSAK